MESINCEVCGGDEFTIKNGYKVCSYCKSKFIEKKKKNSTYISLSDDVDKLKKKCKKEPFRAKMYAKLILEIDPTNTYAQKILKERR